jgi:hypothetical protein
MATCTELKRVIATIQQAAYRALDPECSREDVVGTFKQIHQLALYARQAHNPPRRRECETGTRRATADVTDRALRYRANACPPPGPRICALCGSTRNVEVGHVNGHEEDDAPENLIWTCRSCNVLCGNTLRHAGLGRRTRQYNPAGGAQSLAQWVTAVLSMKGESDAMNVSDAVEMIRATPSERRSKFAKEIWSNRRHRYGSTGRSDSVPF